MFSYFVTISVKRRQCLIRIGYFAADWLTSGAYYPTPITPPEMLSFDWLRGQSKATKSVNFIPRWSHWLDLKFTNINFRLFVLASKQSLMITREISALWVTFSVNRTIWSLSGNTEVRKGLSRFVLCVPPVIHRAIFVVSECSIQSEYLNNKQFDGRKLKTDSWVSDNVLRAVQTERLSWQNNRLKPEV